MKKSFVFAVAASMLGIGICVGYWLKNSQDQLTVETLYTPHLIGSEYQLNPLGTGEGFDRTVSKDDYISWLENAVSQIQQADERRRIDYGNERVSQLIQSAGESAAKVAVLTDPINSDQKALLMARFAQAAAAGVLHSRVNQACTGNYSFSIPGSMLADPAGCSNEVNAQLSSFSDVPVLASYVNELQQIKAANGL